MSFLLNGQLIWAQQFINAVNTQPEETSMIDGLASSLSTISKSYVQIDQLQDTAQWIAVTFQVDAALLFENGELSPEGIFIVGSFNGFNNEPMIEGENHIWSVTLALLPGFYEYKFKNGPDGWENIDIGMGWGDCTYGGYGNRFVEVEDSPINTFPACFGMCGPCFMVIDTHTDDKMLASSIKTFPNPAKKILNVNIDLPHTVNNLNIRVFNVLGEQLMEAYIGSVQRRNIALDLSNVPVGNYILQVGNNQSQFSQSIIVQK